MKLAVFHFHNPDGTITAKCKSLPGWKSTAPTLEESKAKADTEARQRLARDVRVEHFENLGIDWWRAA